jgi:hypothetical protein
MLKYAVAADKQNASADSVMAIQSLTVIVISHDNGRLHYIFGTRQARQE